MYIVAENLNKLPDSMLINYDNTYHRIFFSDDSVMCFICKTSGHISTNCPKKPAETTKESQNEFLQKLIPNKINDMHNPVEPLNSTLLNSTEISDENNQEFNDVQNRSNLTIEQHCDNTVNDEKNEKTKKRAASSSASPLSPTLSQNTEVPSIYVTETENITKTHINITSKTNVSLILPHIITSNEKHEDYGKNNYVPAKTQKI